MSEFKVMAKMLLRAHLFFKHLTAIHKLRFNCSNPRWCALFRYQMICRKKKLFHLATLAYNITRYVCGCLYIQIHRNRSNVINWREKERKWEKQFSAWT